MNKKRVFVIIALSAVFFGAWSCQWHTIEPNEIDVPEEISFASDLESIFVSKCSSCHSSGSPNFTAGNVYETLTTGGYVDTSQPEESSVYTIMKDDVHPNESGTFSDTELAYLLNWIEQGANNN